jgi:hypothetical protein
MKRAGEEMIHSTGYHYSELGAGGLTDIATQLDPSDTHAPGPNG